MSIEVDADEYQFLPQTWTVQSGEAFSVDLVNSGDLKHEWSVIRLDDEIAEESDITDQSVLLRVGPISAGESVTEQVTIDEPGTYQVVCAISGHLAAGMEGSLVAE